MQIRRVAPRYPDGESPARPGPGLCVAFSVLVALLPSGFAAAQGGNVLMIIADDVGVDTIGAYAPLEGSTKVPPTLAIDSLAAQGILFQNVWSNPLCATTRATIQTGRYSYRTGVLGPTGTLPLEEISIANAIDADPAVDVEHAIFGKWGLGDQSTAHPIQAGYDHFAGRPGCCIPRWVGWTRHLATFKPGPSCDPNDPAWHEDLDCIAASTSIEPEYATTKNVDDAVDWINGRAQGQRWFATLAFNAAHYPFRLPPRELHSRPLVNCGLDQQKPTCYRGMIEAMDREIGRLLSQIPAPVLAETTILFLGDNGSPRGMAVPPFDPQRAKFTLYEGGVNVPLIIKGRGVLGTPRIADDLVNTTDLYQTILDLLGVTDRPDAADRVHDSLSLMPILADRCTGRCDVRSSRQVAYAETVNQKAIRNRSGYKLKTEGPVREPGTKWEFFHLPTSPFETQNLVDPATGQLLDPTVEHQTALDELRQLLLGMQEEWLALPAPTLSR